MKRTSLFEGNSSLEASSVLPTSGLRAGTAVFVLAGVAVAIGFWTPPGLYLRLLKLSVAVVVTLLALPFARRGILLGMSLLMIVSLLIPGEMLSVAGFNLSAAVLAVLLLGWFGDMLLIQREFVLPARRFALPVLLFVASACVSLVIGQFPWFPGLAAPITAQVGGLAMFVLSGGAFLLFAARIESIRELERATWIFIVAGSLVTLIRIVPPLEDTLAFLIVPGSIGSLFWTWLVAMVVGQILGNLELKHSWRVALALVAAAALFHGLVQRSWWVSGWLPPLVALVAVVSLRLPRLTVWIGLLAIPLALLTAPLPTEVWSQEEYSLSTRLAAWQVLLQVIETSPIVGFGPANYYHFTPLFPIMGWYVHFSSHNNYVDIVAQTGLLGLALFAWFIFETARLAIAMLRRAATGFSRGYVYGVIGGLSGSIVAGALGDWLVPFVYNVGLRGFRSSVLLWVFLGGLVSLARLTYIGNPASCGHSVTPTSPRG